MKEPNENDFHKQDKDGYWYFDSEDYAEACREYERQKSASPLPSNEDELSNQLLNFCHFLGSEGYKINGYDDGQLRTIINQFLNTTQTPKQ